jgi:hypothetical protein
MPGAECGQVVDDCGNSQDCGVCAGDMMCGEILPNQCDCASYLGGTSTINVPTVEIILNITLDGIAYDESNTNESIEPDIYIEDAVTKEYVARYGVWHYGNNAPMFPITLRMIPGRYNIYYEGSDGLGEWPINSSSMLAENISFEQSGSWTIDVPVVEVTLDVTLDGIAYDESKNT